MTMPVPLNFIEKAFFKDDILSIDIGYSNIKLVHTRKKQGGLLKIVRYAIERTPQGCIRNGVIYNLQGIANDLKMIMQERHINQKNVKIVISAGSSIISRIIFIPKTKNGKLESNIKEEMARQFSADIKPHKLFFRVTGEVLSNCVEYFRVLVTVVPDMIIDNYIRLLNLLDFKPLILEIPFCSTARFFSRGVKLIDIKDKKASEYIDFDRKPTAVIDLGSETTNVSVINNGALEFNKIVLAGGQYIDGLIAGKLEEKRDKAESLKKKHGIKDSDGSCSNIERVVSGCAKDYLGELFVSTKKSLEYYADKCRGVPVNRIFLFGGGAGLNGLRKYAEEIMGLPVYTVDMMRFDNLQFDEGFESEKIRYLVNSLGIAL